MPQWGHAIQLFRTNSLDSLVRYFVSYLPADHIWHPFLPGKGCKRIKTNEATSARRQPLQSPSTGLLRLPAKDQFLEPNEILDSARPAAMCLFPEPGIKRTRPQGHSSHVGHWEDAVSSGHGMRTYSMRQYVPTRDYLPDYLSSRLILQAATREAREVVMSIAK
ncbi:uncharacterized protein B0J16DRAFT_363154 [Fusarium flagelliforme]|uniref:uncharacterized protein n=1 Tax=Fusarium flagelliforme TaxID=2675880 RepID=UPI001E8E5ACA|nr:uncharacterized protein B0J16DRAFT_363154 [Fusarium flagelliforme]KAH7186136.1 hypothetical protein B0J16DRAFT_363154 [Fusarium flagelliforme]